MPHHTDQQSDGQPHPAAPEDIVIDPYLKFLVVSNFPTMRRIMRNLLKELGFANVQEAMDGVGGLSRLRAEPIDFVLADWKMPNMAGIDLLRAIRADSALMNLPVMIVMSSGATREYVDESLQAGANGYFCQPFTAASFNEKLKKVLRSLNSANGMAKATLND